jgi:DNA-binding transcriptional LysR family regulator
MWWMLGAKVSAVNHKLSFNFSIHSIVFRYKQPRPMQYTLHQLRIFLRVVATRNITRAAEELHMSQPAVSIQLKNFQKQFDLPLIEVVNRRIHVTDFGQEIARSAEIILNEVYAINFKMHAHEGRLTGKLRIAAVSTAKYVAPYFLAGFMRANPGVELALDVTNKAQVLARLEENSVDFAFMTVPPEHLQVDALPLFPNRLYLVAHPDFLPSLPTDAPEVFASLPLIMRERGSGTRHVLEGFLLANNVRVLPQLVLTSSEAVKQAVLAGLGCSVMPLVGIRNELASGRLHILPVRGFPITSMWSLVSLSAKLPTPAAQAFLTHLDATRDATIAQHFAD